MVQAAEGGPLYAPAPAGGYTFCGASGIGVLTGISGSISVAVRVNAQNAAWGVTASNMATVDAIALFLR
jgi:hypothetical protein